VKTELGFDSLRKKTPTKETHPYLELIYNSIMAEEKEGVGVGGL